MKADQVLKVTEEQKLLIQREFNKTEQEVAEDIAILKTWLKQQPHLPHNEEDKILELMLYLNKYSLEKTKQKLNMYYTVRTMLPKFYENREPLHKEMQVVKDNYIHVPLPNLTEKAERISIMRLKTNDVSKFDVMNVSKWIINMIDLRYKYDSFISDHHILDMRNHTMAHLIRMTPVWLQQFDVIMEKANSERIMGIHFLNLHSGIAAFVTLFKSIVSEKLGNRLYVHQNIESLHKIFPKDILPSDYGGSLRSLEEINDDWCKFVEENNSYILAQKDKKSNENLRIGEIMDSQMFGIDGSFRMLKDID